MQAEGLRIGGDGDDVLFAIAPRRRVELVRSGDQLDDARHIRPVEIAANQTHVEFAQICVEIGRRLLQRIALRIAGYSPVRSRSSSVTERPSK